MKLSSAILKPGILEMENGFQQLDILLLGEESNEGLEVRNFVQKQMRDLQNLKIRLVALENGRESLLPNLFENYRTLKIRLRFAQRRWRLLISNEARSRKMRERVAHVESFAA